MHNKYDIKLQAGNYVRYFQDVKTTKRDCTTGSRLEPHMKQLINAVGPIARLANYLQYLYFNMVHLYILILDDLW